jgi:uncharacterized membrane protein
VRIRGENSHQANIEEEQIQQVCSGNCRSTAPPFGTLAMSVRKGGRLHRASGNVFTAAILILASSALYLAVMKSQNGNIIAAIITFYMISTAWLAGRRMDIGRLDLAALLVGIGGAAAILTLGVHTLHYPDKNTPAPMCFFLGVVLLLAAAGDVRMLARGDISGRPRVQASLLISTHVFGKLRLGITTLNRRALCGSFHLPDPQNSFLPTLLPSLLPVRALTMLERTSRAAE